MTGKTTSQHSSNSKSNGASTARSGSGTLALPEKKTISTEEREAVLAVFGYFGTVQVAKSFDPEWYVPVDGCRNVAAGYTVESLFAVLTACAATDSIWTLLEYLEDDTELWEQCREAAGELGLYLPVTPPTADVLLELADSLAEPYNDVLTPLTRELAVAAADHVFALRDLAPSVDARTSAGGRRVAARPAGGPAEFDGQGAVGGLGRLGCVTFAELNMSPSRATVFCGEPAPDTPDRPLYRPTFDDAASALLRSLALHTQHGRVVLMLGAPTILWDPYTNFAFEDQLAACDIDTVAVRRTTAGPDHPIDHDSWRPVNDEVLHPVADLSSSDAAAISDALDDAEDLWFDVNCTELRRLSLSAHEDAIGTMQTLRRGLVTVLLYALSQNALTWARACRDGEWDATD